MKIATHHEMENNISRLLERIANGEQICTWSVQHDDYRDDIFNGTYTQCAKVAKRLARNGDNIVGIALIELDEAGCSAHTHDFVAFESL